MRTHVYIDGYNLYYGCLRHSPYKWLDVDSLCRKLLPKNEITAIKYFTARVTARPDDPGAPTRQQAYLRALETIPHLSIVYGHYVQRETTLPRADGKGFSRVLKSEEKGSDVNLGAHLVHDAHRKMCTCAVLISNDSDLAEPLRIAAEELGLTVGVMFPVLRPERRPSRELRRHAKFEKQIRKGALADSQFPDVIETPTGRIHKPTAWITYRIPNYGVGL